MSGSAGASPPGANGILRTRSSGAGSTHWVELIGELDASSRRQAFEACTVTGYVDVVADISQLAFMDCGGYAGLIDAADDLGRRDGSLVLLDPNGEPLRLLTLITELGELLCAPVHSSRRNGTEYDEVGS